METTDVIQPMNIQEYNLLPMGEQAIILWGQGKFLEVWQEDGKYKVGIYLLNDTIVSVNYDLITGRIITIIMWDSITSKKEILEKNGLN